LERTIDPTRCEKKALEGVNLAKRWKRRDRKANSHKRRRMEVVNTTPGLLRKGGKELNLRLIPMPYEPAKGAKSPTKTLKIRRDINESRVKHLAPSIYEKRED